jgi:glycosyltransferase involved in cell wall biosynthesis
MPRVSACVSCLNQPELLKQTLESIQKQTFTDWECIVVDDGSTVPIKPVVDAFNDPRFIFHRFDKNRGIPHGANWAYKHATGEFIQSLGCDEFIWERKFEVQVKYLDEHPEIDCVWGVPGNEKMGEVPSWEQYAYQAHNRSREHWIKCFLLLEGIPIGGASALWRKSLFDSIGYFDDNLTAFSDHEWFLSLFEKHQGRILPYRFMNEVPGHKTICTRTLQNAEKLDAELKRVRQEHPLQVPRCDGLVTVAIPVHNHAKYLGDSLRALFAQTDQNFEVLICDDGSKDDPHSVLKDFPDPRIKFFRSEENIGHMNTVNKMLKIANGEFFISYSADDTMSPDFIQKCREEFKKDPFLEYVASQNDFMTEDGKPHTEPHPLKTIRKATNLPSANDWMNLLRLGNVYFGIGMYRTSALREVGGWDPSHGVISDYEMYLKLLPRYNCKIIEEPLTHTRIHGANQSLLNMAQAKNLKRQYYNAQKPYYRPMPKVVIATPFYELKGFSPYIKSMTETTRLLTMHGIQWEFMDLSGDSYVHRARNSMCMNFLEDPWATDLFFIDSDMAWDPRAFIDIMFRPEPVIGGSYPVKNKWDLWTSQPEIIERDTPNAHFIGIPMPDGSSLIKASRLAGGFLRIKRSVLERYIEFYPMNHYGDTHPIPEARIPQVEFFACGIDREPEVNLLRDIHEEMKKNGSHLDMTPFKERFEKLKEPRDFVGEDYCFSNRLTNMGVPLFIYPNATISHFGVQGWTGNFNTFLNTKPEDRGKVVTNSLSG